MFTQISVNPNKWLLAVAMLLCTTLEALGAEYTFRQLVDLTGQGVTPWFPSLNDHEATTFLATVNVTGAAIMATTPEGDLVTIASSAQGYYVGPPYIGDVHPSINESNTIAFRANRNDYPGVAIYQSFSFGEPIVFVNVNPDPDPGEIHISNLYHPWISDSNGVAYVDETSDGRVSLVYGTLPVAGGPQATTGFGQPDVNFLGTVVAYGINDGIAGINYNGRMVYQSTDSDSAPSINVSGTVAFSSSSYGPPGIYTADGFSTPQLYASGIHPYDPDINNSGLIAYVDNGPFDAAAIFVGTGHELVAGYGSTLFGSNVTKVGFFRGLNNHGQIAFGYQLYDGQRGIALATPRDPSVLGNGDFNNGLGLFEEIYDDQSNFSVDLISVDGDTRLQMTIETGVVGLSQRMETSGEVYLLQFDYDWFTPAGSLDVVVNDVIALSIGADESVFSSVGTPSVQPLDDLTRVSLQFTPAEMADPLAGYIRFDLHPGSEATIQIDNISFAPIPGGVLPGDYNGDGTVNAADYTVYRNRLAGIGGTTLINEGATPGMVTIEDYDFWKAHYGDTIGNGSSLAGAATGVPEPTSLMLCVISMFAICLPRVRRGWNEYRRFAVA